MRIILRINPSPFVFPNASFCPFVFPNASFRPIFRHCFEVATENATYFMFAQTDKEKDEWIGAIGRYAIKSICFLTFVT